MLCLPLFDHVLLYQVFPYPVFVRSSPHYLVIHLPLISNYCSFPWLHHSVGFILSSNVIAQHEHAYALYYVWGHQCMYTCTCGYMHCVTWFTQQFTIATFFHFHYCVLILHVWSVDSPTFSSVISYILNGQSVIWIFQQTFGCFVSFVNLTYSMSLFSFFYFN